MRELGWWDWRLLVPGRGVRFVRQHPARFDGALNAAIPEMACVCSVAAPLGEPCQVSGIADGHGRVTIVNRAGEFHRNISGLSWLVCCLQDQVGATKAPHFVGRDVSGILVPALDTKVFGIQNLHQVQAYFFRHQPRMPGGVDSQLWTSHGRCGPVRRPAGPRSDPGKGDPCLRVGKVRVEP